MMSFLDLSTLSMVVATVRVLNVPVLYLVWRIDRRQPGPLWWLGGAVLFVLGFLGAELAMRALGWPRALAVVLNNTAALTGSLCMLQGVLRFRALGSLPRAAVVLPPVFLAAAYALRGSDALRYLFLDTTLILLCLCSIWALLWRTAEHERVVHGVVALFTLMGALVFGGRLTLALSLENGASLANHPHQKLLFFYLVAYSVGWGYGAGLICYLRAHRAVLDQARQDALTGLPNRRQFEDTLQQQLARGRRGGRPFALGMIDLNGFKRVNDVHGHKVGDAVLVEAARRLRGVLREVDFAARLGGDEFVVLVQDVDGLAGPVAALQRIRAALDGPLAVPGHAGLTISSSLGLAVWPADGTDAEALLHCADQRMYADKPGRGSASDPG